MDEQLTLTAISPLDGRYARHTVELRKTFSEFGLIRYRVVVEIEWLKALAAHTGVEALPAFDAATSARLDELIENFDVGAAARIKKDLEEAAKRREDVRFLTGKGRYTDDINRPGQAHVLFLRSDVAHGTLRNIDTRAASPWPWRMRKLSDDSSLIWRRRPYRRWA